MTSAKPQITSTTHLLPFDKLSEDDFERLCLWLVEREGFHSVEHLGASGSEQGRDLIAWRGQELWAFQCKRVKQFGFKTAEEEIRKILNLPENQLPAKYVFLVSTNVSDTTRQQVRGAFPQLEVHFWAGTELDEKVNRYPEIVKEFFQLPGAEQAYQPVQIDGSKSMGLIFQPSGPVIQYFGTVPEQPEESTLTKPAEGQPERSPQPGGEEQLKPRLLFDESHGQRLWKPLPPTVDQGFHRLKEIASKHFRVEYLGGEGKTTAAHLAGAAAFILAMGPQGKTHLDQEEIDAIQDFVKKGGGLFVMGTYTGDWHHEANLNRLIEYFGIVFNLDVILPEGAGPQDCKAQYGQYLPNAMSVVEAKPVQAVASSPEKHTWSALTRNVDQVLTLSSCSLYIDEAKAIPLLESSPTSLIQEPVPYGITIHIEKCLPRGNGPATLVAASRFSKVVVSGNYKMFLNDFIDHPGYQNRKLWENILKWLTA